MGIYSPYCNSSLYEGRSLLTKSDLSFILHIFCGDEFLSQHGSLLLIISPTHIMQCNHGGAISSPLLECWLEASHRPYLPLRIWVHKHHHQEMGIIGASTDCLPQSTLWAPMSHVPTLCKINSPSPQIPKHLILLQHQLKIQVSSPHSLTHAMYSGRRGVGSHL